VARETSRSKAWPYHLQHASEELLVILEGGGRLRYGGEETPIRAGDVISTGTGKAAGRRWWQAPSGCGPYELFEVLQNDGVDCWEGEL
jgi:mannose-6-phosphate isomerase-like protein (cupin superfamily)